MREYLKLQFLKKNIKSQKFWSQIAIKIRILSGSITCSYIQIWIYKDSPLQG